MLCPTPGGMPWPRVAPGAGDKTFKGGFKGEFCPFLQALAPKKRTLGLLGGYKRPPWPEGPKAPA